jgi:hypothetical protein
MTMDPRDFAHLILWAIGLYLLMRFFIRPLWSAMQGGDAGRDRHCMTCGVDGAPVSRTRGSIGIEILLWLCFIVPGLIYSLWRLTTRHQACASCGATNLVPVSAPAAVAHKASMVAHLER